MLWLLPSPSSPRNVERAYNDSGCDGRFKSTLHSGWRGNARICVVFAKVSQELLARIVDLIKTNNNGFILEKITRQMIKTNQEIKMAYDG